MIWDVVLYAGEWEMLHCRMDELAEIPNLTHLVVQSPVTFRGDPKPTHRFEPIVYGERLRTILYYPPELVKDAWEREIGQRNLADNYLNILPDDIVIVSDVDEIPRASVVADLPKILSRVGGPVSLPMRMHYWSPRWISPRLWMQPKAAYRRDIPAGAHALRMSDKPPGVIPKGLGSAGWHLSWFGGTERCAEKLRRFSHDELDTPETHSKLARWAAEGSNMHDELLERYSGDDWPKGMNWCFPETAKVKFDAT
jgi:beta-1,4-mannosyl-glycoprotein beta-1,4-N-acetylglucosaminyltransferase